MVRITTRDALALYLGVGLVNVPISSNSTVPLAASVRCNANASRCSLRHWLRPVARHFAANSFTNIALFVRTADKLSRDASFVTSSAPAATVRTYPADVADNAALEAALKKAVSDVGAPEVVVYNAARINLARFGEYSAEDVVEDFKLSGVGLYTAATVLMPHLQTLARSNPSAHSALFVTSGAVIHRPTVRQGLFSLAMAKSAQANLAKYLAEENKDAVHVALVMVSGLVAHDAEVLNPTNIAATFWDLYEQEKGSWEFEKGVQKKVSSL